MPARNIVKQYVEDGYYHVYSRGINKQRIFLDKQDYEVFLSLFKRYLSDEPQNDSKKRPYPNFHDEVTLLAYCLMSNHFHAFVLQNNPEAIKELFKSVITAYSTYFNKKYDRQGPVFQSRYKASLILNDAYFEHISRYIHLNPENYEEYPYSSYQFYLGKKHASWVNPASIMDSFTSVKDYERFVADHEGYKETQESLKAELANY
jgi:REP element-mobilizing transposase RayT